MFEFIFSWTMLWWLLLIIYIPACIGLIIIVLMQKGKGVGFAGAFGMGGSEAVFGPRTARSLPQKLTYTAGGIFMIFALLLSAVTGKVGRGVAPETVEEGETAAAESTALDDFFSEEMPEGDVLLDAPAEETAADEDAVPTDAETVVTEPAVEPLDESLEDEVPEVPVNPLEVPLEPEAAEGDDTGAVSDEMSTDQELEAPSFGDVDIEVQPGEATDAETEADEAQPAEDGADEDAAADEEADE